MSHLSLIVQAVKLAFLFLRSLDNYFCWKCKKLLESLAEKDEQTLSFKNIKCRLF